MKWLIIHLETGKILAEVATSVAADREAAWEFFTGSMSKLDGAPSWTPEDAKRLRPLFGIRFMSAGEQEGPETGEGRR